jgi:hypothetical protein
MMRAAVCTATLAAMAGALGAATIPIPNASFESPPTTFAAPFVDSWQQIPQPDLTNSATLITGVFSNVPPPIDNCDGGQALFLFALPQTAVFQDYDSTDYANPTPTDAMSDFIKVAATHIAYTPDLFPSQFHFVDFQVQVPTVQASDRWAGQHIGVQLLSTSTDPSTSGYWDLDSVRLTSTITPALVSPAYTNGTFSFTLRSEPGLVFEILASENATAPLSNWTSLGSLTNLTGATAFSDPTTGPNRRFYRAVQQP